MQPLLVIYRRVSTGKQRESGLGLEGQQAAVNAYVAQVGGKVIGEFTETETGKRSRKVIDLSLPIWQLIDHRPKLRQAIELCTRRKARLVIAKLDRLARDVAFTACLAGSGVDFVACDNQNATPLTINILASVAQEEARLISERTKAALRAARARGVTLGSARPGHWEGREELRRAGGEKGLAKSIEVRVKATEDAYKDVKPMMQALREQGEALCDIARKLNDDGHTTRRGAKWSSTQVGRVLGEYDQDANLHLEAEKGAPCQT